MEGKPHGPCLLKGVLVVCVQSTRPAEELAQHIRARNAARKAELAAALAVLRSKPAGGARVARNPMAAFAAQRPNNQPLALHSAASSPAKVDSLYPVRQSLWSLIRTQHMTHSRNSRARPFAMSQLSCSHMLLNLKPWSYAHHTSANVHTMCDIDTLAHL